jgi:hypothetical protein
LRLTQQIRLDFNVRTRDYLPIEVRLALQDGKQLSLEKVNGKRKKYALAARSVKGTDRENAPKTGSKTPKTPKKPNTIGLEFKVTKRKSSGSGMTRGR